VKGLTTSADAVRSVGPTSAAGAARVQSGTLLLLLAAAALAVVRFTPVVARMVREADFPDHTRFAQALLETGEWQPHFAYHLFVIGAHAILPGVTWMQAAQVVTLAGLGATAAVLAWWIRTSSSARPWGYLLAAVLPLVLLTVQPVLWSVVAANDRWLIGYLPPNQWHSPTTLFSKAPALALFVLGLRALGGARASAGAIGACALVALFSVLIKPSFLMAFVPALVAAALRRRRHSDWRLIGAGIAAPTIVVLGGQFLARYVLALDPETMTFSPLYVIGLYSPVDTATLAQKFVASLLFPLAVTISFPAALREIRLPLAWLVLLCGASYGYLLAEGGQLADHGNFLWSGQLAAFVLFAAAAVELAQRLATGTERGWRIGLRAAVCAAILVWHLESGIRHFSASWLS
jgi:hypothetical protein